MSVLDGESISIRGRRYNLTPCKSCGALMLWATTQNSKLIPIDPKAVADGNLIVVDVKDRGPVMHYLKRDEDPGLTLRYVTHFSTCPDATEHRRK